MTNYAQQASKPSWFGNNTGSIYESATSGNSPFNEWFEFKDRKEALESIRELFCSQSFIDNYVEFTTDDGEAEFYYKDDIILLEDEKTSEYVEYLEKGANPASLSDMINAESKF